MLIMVFGMNLSWKTIGRIVVMSLKLEEGCGRDSRFNKL